MYLGAHVSIAENIALAPERGKAVGAEAIQIFSRSPRMLRRTKPLTMEETQGFRENLQKNGIVHAVIHANYLINLGGADDNTIKYSRDAFVEELDRAQALGVRDVIFHPASHGGKGEASSIRTTAESLDWSFDHANAPDVFAVLENTAGQGAAIGAPVTEEPFREVPGCLEFPGRDAGYKKNLKTLRSLVTGPHPPTSPRAPGGKRGDRGTA